MRANEVAKALRAEAPEIDITAVCAHSNRTKAEALAHDYDIPKVYDDYDEMLREDDADFVYLGLVNTAHYSYARRALQAHRNVIVEKPFTYYIAAAWRGAGVFPTDESWFARVRAFADLLKNPCGSSIKGGEEAR